MKLKKGFEFLKLWPKECYLKYKHLYTYYITFKILKYFSDLKIKLNNKRNTKIKNIMHVNVGRSNIIESSLLAQC